jgi:hypothetical protein
MGENEKIDQCTYWLIDSMLSRSAHTEWILPNVQNSLEVPPFVSIFSTEEVSTSLIKLFDNGYLFASISQGMQKKLFIPTHEKIELAINTKNDENYSNGFYIYLSKKGGKKWELLSRPKWDIYTTILYQIYPEENSGIYEAIILGKQLSWLKKRVSNLFGDPNLDIYDNRYPKMIESKMLNTVPYKPIYWKNLGRCYYLSIKFDLVDKNKLDLDIFNFHKKNMINVERTSLHNYWYTHPYDEFHAHAQHKLKEISKQ